MKKSKKSLVGAAIALMLLSGVIGTGSNVLSVKIVAYYSFVKISPSGKVIGLFGLRSGLKTDRRYKT